MKNEQVSALIVGGAIGLVALAGLLFRFEILADLFFGWIGFLRRTLPELQVRWDGVLILIVALTGLALLSHSLLRWLSREMQKGEENPKRTWRKRSTIALIGFVIAMFVAGVSMIGVVHQTYWLATSEEPLYGERLAWHRSETSDRNQMVEMGFGVHNFYSSRKTLPTQWDVNGKREKHSWVTQILPYINYSTDAIDMHRPWDDPVNAPSFRAVLPTFCNPEFRTPPLRDRRGFGLNHYAGNSLVLGHEQKMTFQDVKGGSSNTLLIGQVNSRFVAWGRPDNNRDPRSGINTPNGFGGAPNSHGARFVMMDGSIRFIHEDVDPNVLNALSTREAD